MINIQGKIQSIYTEGESEFRKKIMTVSISASERCFVEVREEMPKHALKKLKIGDKVKLIIAFEGKLGKTSSHRFNNIIAKHIEKA